MNRDEYIQKTEQLIKETRCKKLAKDPTEGYQATIKETTKKATKIIKPNQIHTLTIMNSSAPPMNALPKIHKLGTPMRPIINHRSAPSYKLSKHLKTILKDNLGLPNKYTISNTTELIEKIKDSAITMDTKLVSFDIKDLYPSIPITETIDIVFKILIEKTGNREIAVEITNTLRTPLHQNYFKFNNNIYMQTNGLGMGNPTSAILMEVFMQNLEERYVEYLTSQLGATFYARYVDDIICLITKKNEGQILEYLNKQHSNIKFTMEQEMQGKLNYLDLTIKINKSTNSLQYEIFRKPTATDIIIHNTSNHPHQHKKAAFRQMINRIERIPLTKEGYNKELNAIYAIAANNGYKRDLVEEIRREHKNKKPNKEENNDKNWAVLTYTGKSTYKLAKVFQKHNLRTSFRTNNNVGRILRDTTNQEDPLDKQGVYKLTCKCQHSYIGQTGRKIKTRFREHIRDYNKKTQKPSAIPESNFANHMFNNKCSPTQIRKAAKLLHNSVTQKGTCNQKQHPNSQGPIPLPSVPQQPPPGFLSRDAQDGTGRETACRPRAPPLRQLPVAASHGEDLRISPKMRTLPGPAL
ncbi:uncharacterized protein LOC118734935 [Rhagoletis pomonella]|uniref:uncharacterized protein LOC118734935 n=1 Tax=Rhagoletis pomonella TaxID=28610 RepID=UPI001780BE5D|nr:uncharacterized protein LOC118734935 [Rhagoletis pomonella]